MLKFTQSVLGWNVGWCFVLGTHKDEQGIMSSLPLGEIESHYKKRGTIKTKINYFLPKDIEEETEESKLKF